jgi:hypothetical protein
MIFVQKGAIGSALFALTALTLTACANTNYQGQNNYKPNECKQMHGRGLINLEEKQKCMKGLAFDNKSGNLNPSASTGKEPPPCCASMSGDKGGMCQEKHKTDMDHTK